MLEVSWSMSTVETKGHVSPPRVKILIQYNSNLLQTFSTYSSKGDFIRNCFNFDPTFFSFSNFGKKSSNSAFSVLWVPLLLFGRFGLHPQHEADSSFLATHAGSKQSGSGFQCSLGCPKKHFLFILAPQINCKTMHPDIL